MPGMIFVMAGSKYLGSVPVYDWPLSFWLINIVYQEARSIRWRGPADYWVVDIGEDAADQARG